MRVSLIIRTDKGGGGGGQSDLFVKLVFEIAVVQ